MRVTSGTRLGTYEVLSPIGAGGMGEVYRARDTRLGRDVALKLLPQDVAADAERLMRFQREAKTLAALDHPGIVTVYSVEEVSAPTGAGTGPVHFITMQLVEGDSLDRLIPDGGLPIDRLFEIAGALADAVAAAHDKGIVHRDLKPANVMIARDGRVKVLDFGLAKAIGATEASASAVTAIRPPSSNATGAGHTAVGVVMGTPAYMSPEQIAGQPVGHRSDIFSIGIVIYEMATGQRPFSGSSSIELASSILRDTPPLVTVRRTDLPDAFGQLVRGCLEKDADARVDSARTLADRLRAAKTQAAAARPQLAIAVLPFEDMSPARDQQHLCEGMAEEVMNALVGIDGVRVASRTSTFRAQRDGGSLQSIAQTLSVTHVLEGGVRLAGPRLRVSARLTEAAQGFQMWSDRYDRDSTDIFAVQDDIAAAVLEAVKSRLAPGDHNVRERPNAVNVDAYRRYLRGRYLRQTKEDHAAALAEFQEAVRLDPSHGPAWTGLAEGLSLAAHFALVPARDACATARQYLATAAQLQGESADASGVECFVAFIERRFQDSDAFARRALELNRFHVPTLGAWGVFLAVRQQRDEALRIFARAREADPLAAFPYALTGAGLLATGRAAESLRYFDDAFSFEKENLVALWASSMAKAALGRFDEAIATAEHMVLISQRAAHFLGILGWVYAVSGRTDHARTVLGELQGRPADAPTAVSEGWLLGALGERDAALSLFRRAEEECQAFLYYVGLPAFDPFRDDPRFAAMMQRLGLPSVAIP